jgi:hypothetical protein
VAVDIRGFIFNFCGSATQLPQSAAAADAAALYLCPLSSPESFLQAKLSSFWIKTTVWPLNLENYC